MTGDASSAAVPDVTALAQTIREAFVTDIVGPRRALRIAGKNALDALLALVERQAEEIRLREESQIPVIPRAAKERLDRAERERDAAVARERTVREGLERVANYTKPVRVSPTVVHQHACGHVAEVIEIARAALAVADTPAGENK